MLPEQAVAGLPPVDLATLDLLPDPAWVTPCDPALSYFNVAWLAFTGTAERAIPAARFVAFLHPEDRDRRMAEWREGLAGGSAFASHVRFQDRAGAYRWFLIRTCPVGDRGTIAGWLTTAVDVEGERRANDELLAAQARELSIANAIPQLIGVTGPDGSVISVNASHREYTGLTDDDMRGTGWTPIVHPTTSPPERGVARAVEDGQPYDTQYRMRRHDGTYRWFLNKAQPVRDPTARSPRGSAPRPTSTSKTRGRRAAGRRRGVVGVRGHARRERRTPAAGRHRRAPHRRWCAVSLLDASGALKPAAIAHRDPSRVRFAREFTAPVPAACGQPFHGVVHNRRPDPHQRHQRRDVRQIENPRSAPWRGVGLRAYLIVPLAVEDHRYGAVDARALRKRSPFTDVDQQSPADRAARRDRRRQRAAVRASGSRHTHAPVGVPSAGAAPGR